MAAVTKQVEAAKTAFQVLGITSSVTLRKQATDAIAAYNAIRSSGTSTAHDIKEAWVAMEKARQTAAIAAGQVISASEKKTLQNAEANLGQHVKTMKDTWKAAGTAIKQTIESDLSRTITNVIFQVGSIGDAFKQMAQDVVGIIVDTLITKGIELFISKLFEQKVMTSAIDVANIMGAAAVAAANAFASIAAIPIVGPAMAPAAAAAAYSATAAFAPLASFDKGGFIPEDMIAQVHKGEFVLTADQVAGRKPLPPSARSNDGGTYITNFNINGARNPRETAREIMRHMKTVSPKFSPAS